MNIKDRISVFKNALESYYDEAKSILTDRSKLSAFLEKVELKLESVPIIGEELKNLVIVVEILKDYITHQYDSIPMSSLIAMVAALIYFVTPIDLVLDSIPLLGFLDDLTVLRIALDMVRQDVDTYLKWKQGKKEE